jgi:DeoR-like protein with HTH domain
LLKQAINLLVQIKRKPKRDLFHVFLLHVNYYNLVELVNARGSVRNVDLVDLLGVTEPTIRKDMMILEKQGVLKRTHGGASAEKCRGKRSHRKACVQEIHDGVSCKTSKL